MTLRFHLHVNRCDPCTLHKSNLPQGLGDCLIEAAGVRFVADFMMGGNKEEKTMQECAVKEIKTLTWTEPAYCDVRLGFEVTAYIYVR